MRLRQRLRALFHRVARPAAFLRDISEPVDDLTRLADRYGTDKGTAFAGRHHYTRVYSELFEPLRMQPVRLLEIGLLHIGGGWAEPEKRDSGEASADRAPSLRMWADYFPRGQIYGFDINDFSRLNLPRCRVFRGDMGRRDDLEALVGASSGEFDIVVEDGSHASHHQQIALACLFRSLKPGGVYAIEDLTFQRPELELRNAIPTRDVLRAAQCTGEFRSPFMTEAESRYLEEQVEDIALFDSLTPGCALDGRDGLAILRKRG